MDATTLSDRTVLRVAGEDVRGFLQGLLTNDLAALAPGAPQWAGLLTPQGKALFDMILWDAGDGDGAVLIDAEAAGWYHRRFRPSARGVGQAVDRGAGSGGGRLARPPARARPR